MSEPDYDLLSSYAGLLSLATLSIYVGAHGSLPNAKNADGTPDEDEEVSERMSSEDAWLFPVIGSITLFGLYLIVKFYGTEWINWLLGWYFSVAGVGSVWKSSIALARFVVGDVRWKGFDNVSLVVRKGATELVSLSCRTPSLYLFPLSAVPSALYTFFSATRKSVLLTDVLSMSFSHNALSLLKIDSFKTGCILLAGLFVYDIWWVFGTEVMVKVATSLDVPIKLLWPKSLAFSADRGFTMLGLGDVVVPGIFIALALRFDHHRAGAKTGRFAKPYFHASLAAYVAGLVTTMTVMHVFGKAQPALLYLSPACITAFVATGAIRGELKIAWEWSDEAQVEKVAEKVAEKTAESPAADSKSK